MSEGEEQRVKNEDEIGKSQSSQLKFECELPTITSPECQRDAE